MNWRQINDYHYYYYLNILQNTLASSRANLIPMQARGPGPKAMKENLETENVFKFLIEKQ